MQDQQTTWLEVLKLTAVVLGWIIGFWLFLFGILNICEHFYEIKMFFGFGGQIIQLTRFGKYNIIKENMKQPDPIKNDNPAIVDLVVEDLKERKKLGLERYGVALQKDNGRDMLQDLYEELQDAVIYIKGVLEEKK